MGSIELKLSCSFCLRAPQPNPVVRQPSVHPPPNATDRSYSSCPTIRERGSISAGCVPLRLIQPIPSTGTKAENEEGRKRLRWGRRNERARANYRVVARKSKRQKTERGKEGKGRENEDPRLSKRRKGGKRRELAEPHGRLTIFYCRVCRR